MSAEVWGVIAAFAGVGVAFLTVFVVAFFYLLSTIQKLGQDIRAEFQEERRVWQAEIQEERRVRQVEIQEERRERLAESQRERSERLAEIQEERSERLAESQKERSERLAEHHEERRERQAENQRLFDSLYRHRHDQDDSMYVPAADD